MKEIEVCKTGRFWTVTARRCNPLLDRLSPIGQWAASAYVVATRNSQEGQSRGPSMSENQD